jgi:hypothetical protein
MYTSGKRLGVTNGVMLIAPSTLGIGLPDSGDVKCGYGPGHGCVPRNNVQQLVSTQSGTEVVKVYREAGLEASVPPVKIRQDSQSGTSTLANARELEFSVIAERTSVTSMARTYKPTKSHNHAPVPHRISDLRRERAELKEEVLQSRAAVQIWEDVWRQTRSRAVGSEALREEMR